MHINTHQQNTLIYFRAYNKLLLGLVILAAFSIQLRSQPLTSDISLIKGPVKPTVLPKSELSVLLGRSAHQVGKESELRYAPLEDGGFQIIGGNKSFNRAITIGRNNIATGDLPIFKIHTTTGSGVYAKDRSYPLFPRHDSRSSKVTPELGTLRLAVPGPRGSLTWLDKLRSIKTTFRPGYTVYEIEGPKKHWKATLTMAPTIEENGFICKVEFNRPLPLQWIYSDLYWSPKEKNNNSVSFKVNTAKLSESNLPKGVIHIGWDAQGSIKKGKAKHGESAVFQSTKDQKIYHIVGTWGVTEYDKTAADEVLSRLNTTTANTWPQKRDKLKKLWFDCYIGKALEPEAKFKKLLKKPSAFLQKSMDHWDQRRSEFQIKTPDAYFNAVLNFERAISDYHLMGPGMVLSSFKWIMYSHISVGWYGKMWAGDLEAVKDHMRLLGAMQRKDGYISWISPSLHAYTAENNTPYWVDHVWWLYAWTGDKEFLQDLWPAVKKAVEWEDKNNDPDGDGLYRSHYEYWNCDSNGKGPKAATPTTTAWAMHDRAAKMAEILGDLQANDIYRARTNKIRTQAFKQLWNEEQGILGSRGGNDVWRGHPQTWEQYLGINNGMIPANKGIRAMRWLEAQYGFEPNKGIKLLMNCDWWPLRWSVHWVPTGDTCLAAMAGMKSGDTDLWWPYLQTAAMSAFRSDSPSVRFAIGNKGTGSGGIEFIDSDDPFMHTAVRGLFGVKPEIHNERLNIMPSFPSDWKEASMKNPLVDYQYSRKGDKVTLIIKTAKPLIKVVRAYPGAKAIITAKESVSSISYQLPKKTTQVPVLESKQIFTESKPRNKEAELSKQVQDKLIQLDLTANYNTTLTTLTTKTNFLFDTGRIHTINKWWQTPGIKMTPGSRNLESENGMSFLIGPRDSQKNHILALASWGKNGPLPSIAKIPINKKLDKLWLLMQNYVSPIKNYIPNGEVILHYLEGAPETTSLIPPYNIDCYFQEFSREGSSIDLGELIWHSKHGHSPVKRETAKAHASTLSISCDPTRTLKTIEIRATVSEGVIGLNAITLLPAEQ